MALLSTQKREARRRGWWAAGCWAAAAWQGQAVFSGGDVFLSFILVVGASLLTWRWLRYRGQWGMRF